MNNIHRVLAIKLRHIGDVLLAAPALHALKKARPDASITVVVPAGTEDMLTLNPDIDEVVPLRKGAGALAEISLVRRLRARRFDLAINMTEGDRGAIISFLSGARLRIGVDPRGRGLLGKKRLYTHAVPPVYDGRHRALMDMDLLGPLGIGPQKPELRLFTLPGDDRLVDKVLRENGIGKDTPLAVVHPASRWLFKCWRDEAMAGVVDYLEGRGIRVAVTSGPAADEIEKAQNVLSLARTRPVNLAGRLKLKALAALLKRSVLFFGVDTAPMHIASAMGTPVVVLFGPSDSRVWGPLSACSKVIAKAAEFPCLPCRKDGCGGSKKSACLDAITVDEAVAAIEGLLAARGLK